MNEWMVGEKESWSSSNNNKSSCSKQWTNIATNKPINNQNLQYKTILNPPNWCWVTTINLSIQSRATTKWYSFSVICYSESIHHRFIYLDCLKLECILDICLFSHIVLFFYSINPNSNPVDIVCRINLLDAFTDPW